MPMVCFLLTVACLLPLVSTGASSFDFFFLLVYTGRWLMPESIVLAHAICPLKCDDRPKGGTIYQHSPFEDCWLTVSCTWVLKLVATWLQEIFLSLNFHDQFSNWYSFDNYVVGTFTAKCLFPSVCLSVSLKWIRYIPPATLQRECHFIWTC